MTRPCGTHYAYTCGCRCDACRAANTNRQKLWRQMRRLTGEPRREFEKQFAEPVFSDFRAAGDWVANALCKANGDKWLLADNQMHSDNPRRFASLAWAIDACDICPTKAECRRWVLAHTVDPCPWHVVAGMTPRQRNKERRDMGMSTPGRHIKEEVA